MIYELQSEAIFARGQETVAIPMQESGIINQDILAMMKERLVNDSIKWGANHLVKDKQSYPDGEMVQTELTLNMVVLPEHIYTKLIRFLDE